MSMHANDTNLHYSSNDATLNEDLKGNDSWLKGYNLSPFFLNYYRTWKKYLSISFLTIYNPSSHIFARGVPKL